MRDALRTVPFHVAIDLMVARLKKTKHLVMGTTALVLGAVAAWQVVPESRPTWSFGLISVWFVFCGLWVLCLGVRKMPELEISPEAVLIRGTRFDRKGIKSARVFRGGNRWGSGHGRYFSGIPLAPEPRLIVMLNATDLTDQQINDGLASVFAGNP